MTDDDQTSMDFETAPTLYIAGSPIAGTNVKITNGPSLHQAALRRDIGMQRAGAKADRDGGGGGGGGGGGSGPGPGGSGGNAGGKWTDRALAAVRVYAATHAEPFLTETMREALVGKVDQPKNGKAWGRVVTLAEAAGILQNTGKSARAKSSNLSPKWLWQSRIYGQTVS